MVCKGVFSKPVSVCSDCHGRIGYGLFLPARVIWYFLLSDLCKEEKCHKCASQKLQDGRTVCETCIERTKSEVKRAKKELEEAKMTNFELQETLNRLRYTAASNTHTQSEALKAATALLALQQHCKALLSELTQEHIHRQKTHQRHSQARSHLASVVSDLQKLSV